jgi:hypothetical protein
MEQRGHRIEARDVIHLRRVVRTLFNVEAEFVAITTLMKVVNAAPSLGAFQA